MALTKISTDTIADSAITAIKIADGTVVAAEIGADAIDGTKLADNAVNSEHYTDGSIDLAHLAADSVDGTKIADDAINSEHYADGSIDNAHIADDAIDSEHYAAGSVDDAHLATGISASKLTGALPAISGASLTDTIYDIAFTAGFDNDMVKENVAVATYGEMVMARAGTFVGEAGYIDTAATGAILIVDIMKNGTTIYASTKPQFAISATGLTAGVLTVTSFAAADRITFKATQIGSSTVGQGVRFTLKCKV